VESSITSKGERACRSGKEQRSYQCAESGKIGTETGGHITCARSAAPSIAAAPLASSSVAARAPPPPISPPAPPPATCKGKRNSRERRGMEKGSAKQSSRGGAQSVCGAVLELAVVYWQSIQCIGSMGRQGSSRSSQQIIRPSRRQIVQRDRWVFKARLWRSDRDRGTQTSTDGLPVKQVPGSLDQGGRQVRSSQWLLPALRPQSTLLRHPPLPRPA
jgi:hypothetical protein